jgi:hypothetical protein
MNNFENHYGKALFQMALKQNEDQNLKSKWMSFINCTNPMQTSMNS